MDPIRAKRKREEKKNQQEKKMSHLELTYRPLRAEYMRGTYIITELVLSVSFRVLGKIRS